MSMTKQTCATCAHDGQCADLHHCGGACWAPADDDAGEEGCGARDHDPYDDGPDPYEQWEHDAEIWQESADRRW